MSRLTRRGPCESRVEGEPGFHLGRSPPGQVQTFFTHISGPFLQHHTHVFTHRTTVACHQNRSKTLRWPDQLSNQRTYQSGSNFSMNLPIYFHLERQKLHHFSKHNMINSCERMASRFRNHGDERCAARVELF